MVAGSSRHLFVRPGLPDPSFPLSGEIPMPRHPSRRWITAGLILLAALAGVAPPAQARGTPTISFQPDGRTFYGPNQQVQVHICDDSSVRDASTRVMYLWTVRLTWNNGQVVVHEAVHGMRNPRSAVGANYMDGAITEIGLTIDGSAQYCMGMRGR
jgi:hypothetical protein